MASNAYSLPGTAGSSGGGPSGISEERPGGAERAGGQQPTAQMHLKSILKKVAKLNILRDCTQSLSPIFYTAEQLQ